MHRLQPPWRIKTQPCPFYQKQRCFFSDSCNFVHEISTLPILEKVTAEMPYEDTIRTPQNLPKVIVDSPHSVISPSRSPRTRSLLLALRDVIGDPDDDVLPYERGMSSWSESLPTLVDKDSFDQTYVDGLQNDTSDEEADWQPYSPNTPLSLQNSIEMRTSSPFTREEDVVPEKANWSAPSDYANPSRISVSLSKRSIDSVILEDEDETIKLSNISNGTDGPLSEPSSSSFISRQSVYTDRTSSLLSPIELSTLDLGPFRRSRASSFFTSSDPADWKQPLPLQPSPPRSPSIASTMAEMLSSPFGSHATRILSPRFSVFLNKSPNLSARDSPQLQQEIEPLDLSLDSPRSHAVQTPHPMNVEEISASWKNRRRDPEEDESSNDEEDGEEEEDFILGDSSGNTSVRESDCGQTSLDILVDPEAVREQVTEAIKKANRIPTHFLSRQDSSFTEDDTVHSSLLSKVVDGEDICASLGNVLSESTNDDASPIRTDATISLKNDSLYDIYSGIASPQNVLADSIRNVPLSPPFPDTPLIDPSDLSRRDRVFTPPSASLPYSANVKTLDLNVSPRAYLDSNSGRILPYSPHGHGTSTIIDSSNTGESRKVPIGSRRHSIRSQSSISSSVRRLPFSPPLNDIEGSPSPSVASSSSSLDSSRRKGLRPLRLSTISLSQPLSRSLFESRISASVATGFSSRNAHHKSAASVSSSFSSSNNRLLSAQTPTNPLRDRSFSTTSDLEDASLSTERPIKSPLHDEPVATTSFTHSPLPPHDEDDTTDSLKLNSESIRRSIRISRQPSFVTDTVRPTLMFAIASDDVEQVERVLKSEAANPNEAVGPQSALAFTLTNDKLANKLEIVKTLLAYGADPESVKSIEGPVSGSSEKATDADDSAQSIAKGVVLENLDHATRYYLERADAMHTKRSSALIQRSFFKPLTRVRYELIGQDRALEQLFRVLSMRSRELTVAPIVVMLCGPSGHGKSLLARKFGSLLEVPTHTVNMTTLRTSHDLWQSYSMGAYEAASNSTLAEFLINNEGQKCVVVLDEIEKTADEKILWSLYLPWELGRCAIELTGRQVDVRNVIWLGTSNIGSDLIFQYQTARPNPVDMMSREEYLEVMSQLRPKVSERLGASVLSRVSTVLPFVPFTLQEKKAICTESLFSVGGETCHSLDKTAIEAIIDGAIADYYPTEGARSLHRAISNQLLDIL